jgi:predicted RNA binding protein YcfA (HicA-like mRNA interferase family)
MGKIPGIAHLRAVKALERAGFRIARQGKHIVMTAGVRIITIPRGAGVRIGSTSSGRYLHSLIDARRRCGRSTYS